MRYIDIVRTVVRNAQEKDIPAITLDEQRHHINAIRQKIDDIEIVARCKDCKHRYMDGDVTHYYWCKLHDRPVDDTDYCAWGEREGGDSE